MALGITRRDLHEAGLPNTSDIVWRGPIELCGGFVEITKKAFSDSGFSNRRWDEDDLKSGVYITPDYLWDDKVIEKRPAITVAIGDLSFKQIPSMFHAGVVDDNQRGEHGVESMFSEQASGSVTWSIIAESRGEALALAGELARYLQVYQMPIRCDLSLMSFHVEQISPLAVVKEARERLQTTVFARFGYNQSWSLVKEAPKARIDLEIHGAG